MTIRHHPDDATLMSFAAGALPQAFAAIVAAHLSMCPRCRDEIATLQLVGAALIDTLPPRAMEQAAPAPQTWAATDNDTRRPRTPHGGAAHLPWPLGQLVSGPLSDVRWEQVAQGLWQHHIHLPNPSGGRLRLLKAAPGCAIPEHGHHGAEMTMVLEGAYRDEIGQFRIGDVADLDEGLEHMPMADQEVGCICVFANEMPPRFKGLLLRLAQPFMKF
jgi:putative transcriptional regulator